MMPLSAYRSGPPVTVNVFPEPVWPYAKMVPLKPSRVPSTTFRATLSNTCHHQHLAVASSLAGSGLSWISHQSHWCGRNHVNFQHELSAAALKMRSMLLPAGPGNILRSTPQEGLTAWLTMNTRATEPVTGSGSDLLLLCCCCENTVEGESIVLSLIVDWPEVDSFKVRIAQRN